jgi:hypothetical protein
LCRVANRDQFRDGRKVDFVAEFIAQIGKPRRQLGVFLAGELVLLFVERRESQPVYPRNFLGNAAAVGCLDHRGHVFADADVRKSWA